MRLALDRTPARLAGPPARGAGVTATLHRLYPLLVALVRVKPDASFVQIGGHPDARGNPLRDVVARSRWRGVVVEPIPAKADELERIYGGVGLVRAVVERAAIASSDGEQPFFRDPLTMTGALRCEVLYFPGRFRSDLDDAVVDFVTLTLTFDSLCRRHGIDGVDVLWVATAGDEAEILGEIDLERLRPTLLAFDRSLLAAEVTRALVRRLEALGYESLEVGLETWCLGSGALSACDALVVRSVRRISPPRPRVCSSCAGAISRSTSRRSSTTSGARQESRTTST